MTTYKLTPTASHDVTGLATPLMGWHFTAATAMDIFESFIYLQIAGWMWNLYPTPENPRTQQMSLVKSFAPGQPPTQFIVNTPQWIAIDGVMLHILEQDDVDTNYVVEPYTPPALPSPPARESAILATLPGMPAPEPIPPTGDSPQHQ